MINEDNLSSYLMLFYKSNDAIVIDLKNSLILNNYVYLSLITNIGEGSNEINSETDFIIAQDGKVVVLDDFRDNGVSKDTEIGTVSLYYGEDVYGLYVNGNEYYIGTLDNTISMQIKVRNGDLTIIVKSRIKRIKVLLMQSVLNDAEGFTEISNLSNCLQPQCLSVFETGSYF